MTQRVYFTSADPEVVSYIPYQVNKLNSKYNYSIPELKEEIKKLNLNCKSEHKFIPPEYLRGSVDQRMEILKGLMDTDGYCGKDGYIEYSTSSEQLSKDVVDLCRSLGIITS